MRWWERKSEYCLSTGWCCCFIKTAERSCIALTEDFKYSFTSERIKKDVHSPFLLSNSLTNPVCCDLPVIQCF